MTETLSAQLELGWRYNPLERRNAHGEWSRLGADADKVLSGMSWSDKGSPYKAPPVDRVNKLGGKASDNPFIRKYGLSAKNIVSAYDASTPDERDQGARWYSDAHDVAQKLGGGDADKGAAMMSAFSVQTDWATDVMNSAHTLANGQVPEHGVGITGSVRDRAQKILAAKSTADIEKLFPEAGSSKTRSFYHLIRNGGDTPGDQAGEVVIDRHALSVAAGRRLTSAETEAPSYADIKEAHPDWSDEQAKAYKATFPADPTGAVSTYQHIADMYRQAAKTVSDRDGIQVSPHQMQAITWMHQLNSNDADDSHLVELGAEAARSGGKFGSVPGAATAKGRASSMQKRWAAWAAYARAHHVPVQAGTTAMAMVTETITGQLLHLASYEGRHIAGTPYTFRHGWILLNPRAGQAVSHPTMGTGKVTGVSNGTASVDFGNGQRASFATENPDNPEVNFDDSPRGFKHVNDVQVTGPGITDDEENSLFDYISPEGSEAINGALRSGIPLPKGNGKIRDMKTGQATNPLAGLFGGGPKPGPVPDRNQEIKQLDQLISENTLTSDAHVFRGLAMTPALADQLKPGTVFTDKGFTSTSDSMDWAQKFAGLRSGAAEDDMASVKPVSGGRPVVMHITVPAGQHAVQGEPGIGEYILPRGGQYRVDSISPDGSTYNLTMTGTAHDSDIASGADAQGVLSQVSPSNAVASVQKLTALGMSPKDAANTVIAQLSKAKGSIDSALQKVKSGAG
jgi:hypothetical protein